MPIFNYQNNYDTHHNSNHKFRYYSRRILDKPSDLTYHKLRIEASKNFAANEPLQGALADMFYGCWFEIPFEGSNILDQLKERLAPRLYHAFNLYVQQHMYMMPHSKLATRWSVLVTPTLNVENHKLRVSSDDARRLANNVVIELIAAKSSGDIEQIRQVEIEFFAHCIACVDRIGFSVAWFRLAKNNWNFHEDWYKCQKHLEVLKA